MFTSSAPQELHPSLGTPLVSPWANLPNLVTEDEYWAKYYEDSEHHYEWNNGSLEEKGVSDKLTLLSYEWFFELLRNYLRTTQVGDLITLETGFRLPLTQKTTIRKPDLGVILHNNPIPWHDTDNSFRGICDLCVEAISDSNEQQIERDTIIKFHEYEQIRVPEYYILYAHGKHQEFYRLNRHGVYTPIRTKDPDIIRSQVLPGFQFRVTDLQNKPSPEEMSNDSVYRKFMLPLLQEEKRARQIAEKQEKIAKKHLQQERKARQQEQKARQLAEKQAGHEREARLIAEKQAWQEREARQALEVRLRQLETQLLSNLESNMSLS